MPTDTPETDALIERANDLAFAQEAWAAMCKHARNLERQRTSLRGQLSLANHHARGRWGDYERALDDRDHYRAALEKIAAMEDACPDDLSAKQAREALANTKVTQMHSEDGASNPPSA